MKFSAVIPVYKNHSLFLKNLKHNLKFLRGVEIVVVDDDPNSDLRERLKEFNVIYLKNEKNLGFSATVNRGVKKANGEIVLLLNTDVKILKLDFSLLEKQFIFEKDLFAVSFLQVDKGEKLGRNFLYWRRGFFHHTKVNNFFEGINSWAEGGACAIDKKKFIEIGGFLEELYSPFYWEDIDLSYRAWKAGYKIFFVPDFKVEHLHESTIGKYFKKDRVKAIAYRNSFLFIWTNLKDKNLLIEHLFSLPFALVKVSLKDPLFFKGFLSSLRYIPKVIEIRRRLGKIFRVSDKKILDLFKKELDQER